MAISHEEIQPFKLGRLIPWQSAVFTDPSRFKIVCCGRRAGKTSLARAIIHLSALSKPEQNIAVAYPSLKFAKTVLFDDLLQDYDNNRPYFSHTYKNYMQFYYANGSRVRLFGLEEPKSLRGNKFNLVILDEYQELKNNDILNQVILPTLTQTDSMFGPALQEPGKLYIFGTSKGRNAFHELITIGKSGVNPSYKSWIIPTTVKNCPHIPSNELDELRAVIPVAAYDREYLCSFASYEGLVYSEFSRDLHVINRLPEGPIKKAIIGIDFGYSPHPCGISVVVQMEDNRWVVVEEIKKTKLTMSDDSLIGIAKSLIKKWSVSIIFASPEEGEKINQLKKSLNITVKKANNKVNDGISVIQKLVHHNADNPNNKIPPKLYFLSHCVETIKEMEGYAYSETKETPIKTNDDLMDAMRYAIFSSLTSSAGTTPAAGRVY